MTFLRSARSRGLGLVVILVGALALVTPWTATEWTVELVGVFLVVVGLIALLHAIRRWRTDEAHGSYLGAVIAILAGLLLFARPVLVLAAVMRLLAALIVVAGLWNLAQTARQPRQLRLSALVGNALAIVLGVVLWRLGPAFGEVALALVLGAWMLVIGWRILLARGDDASLEGPWIPDDHHPDPRLGLPANPEFGRLTRALLEQERHRWRIDLAWVVTLAVVFFLTHAGRMDLPWNIFGVASTAVAVVGDLVTAVLITVVLLLPARLSLRTLTRFLEVRAWRHRLAGSGAPPRHPLGDRLVDMWLDERLRFAVRLRQARASLGLTLWWTLQNGLPLTAVLIAVNPIWGFNWYFNSENWVTGVWQKLTEARVDPWRERMMDAVQAQGRPGVPSETLWAVHPPEIAGPDFSFLVIGDPGEGDPSQSILRDRYLLEGRRDDVKFIVISSDVIYPAGAIRDYEFKFYLPFKGFTKPIYAIPGNHDWFDALEGFTANFLEADAARTALRARRAADRLSETLAGAPVEAFLTEAARLRREYGVQTGLQRAPFFEMHTERFALIAVDTGIRRRIDARQRAWLEAALERARGKFVMAVLGHPFYAGGHAQGAEDPNFASLHQLLRQHEVPLVMAGDTHDFEYYREGYPGRRGPAVMHHFVNGGGGAYLSIGTALSWHWAYYPSTAALRAKLDTETPSWKWPVWWWVKELGGWPSSPETLSGVFDFNRAPFFQSFAEILVEGSAGRVRVRLHGVHGPLRWRDLQTGGRVVPEGRSPDDEVEFTIPFPAAP
jgi:uncharacterized membrane protein HdeD (DUF308 family)